MALAAPIARALRSPVAVRGHRHERDLATPTGFDELKAHLHAIAVRVVHDQLPLADESVIPRIERGRVSCVGDLFHTDCDVHAAILYD